MAAPGTTCDELDRTPPPFRPSAAVDSGVRLDRLDSYLSRFVSKVTAVTSGGGALPPGTWLRLERSAFYPTAGGQQHDTGTIGDWDVVDVVEAEGAVWHRLADSQQTTAAAILDEAETVVAAQQELVCAVAWQRRFKHMQRHTAEHMLAQAFTRVGPGYHVQAVSMRGPDCTIDLSGEPDGAALTAAEAEVNGVARQGLPVVTFEVEDFRLGDYPLRRPTKRSGAIRLVAIGDYDVAACGGTHVKNTAEVLPIKILDRDRIKGDLTRITFRAGEEAFDDLAARTQATLELTRLLSTPLEDQVERVRRLLDEAVGLRKELTQRSAAAATGLAERLLAHAVRLGSERVISHLLEGGDGALLDPLVEALQVADGVVSLLAAWEDGRIRLAFLAGPGAKVDVRPALQTALTHVGGRGGGRPDRAQGAGSGDAAAAAAALQAALSSLGAA